MVITPIFQALDFMYNCNSSNDHDNESDDTRVMMTLQELGERIEEPTNPIHITSLWNKGTPRGRTAVPN